MEKIFSKKTILNNRIFEQEEDNDEVKDENNEGKENGSFTTLV